MTANPILAQFVRGNWVENRHRGAYCVVDAQGAVVAGAGDVARPVFPRSAIKALQALPLFSSGAETAFGLGDDALALACASHYGESEHVAVAARMLDAIGLTPGDLECGVHPPSGAGARAALRAAGEKPSPLHNNCSGKHAGMLAVARALGVDHAGYVRRDHRVQREVRQAVEAVIGVPLSEDRCGTDGCSIPTWAAPLSAFARGFARMATGEGLDAGTGGAAARLFAAIAAHPRLVAGTGGFDSEIIAAFDGRLVVKVGAQGVYCGALRDKGLGFALKCDDGNVEAATAMVAALLRAHADPTPAQDAALAAHAHKVAANWRGLEVGAMTAVAPA